MTNKQKTGKRLSDTELLRAVSDLVESDAGFESDCVQLDFINGRKVSQREKTLADLVSEIYQVVHPRFSKCCRHKLLTHDN